MPRLCTFSIVACDPADGACGVAVASRFPAVGARVPWAAADAGAVATQSYANTSYGPRGLERMRRGESAAQALQALLADDPGRAQRQAGLVDRRGGAATFSGEACLDWSGGLTGEGWAVQGNILAGPQVVEAMAAAFTAAPGDLGDRLLAALLAGDRAGGDRRGRQSAALLAVKPEAGYGGFDDIWLDYRVDDHPDPVPRLGELLGLHRLYFGVTPPEQRLPLAGEHARRLQRIMSRLGHYQGPDHGRLDDPTRRALEAFLGNENFEERVDLAAGRIDPPVLDYLYKTFPD